MKQFLVPHSCGFIGAVANYAAFAEPFTWPRQRMCRAHTSLLSKQYSTIRRSVTAQHHLVSSNFDMFWLSQSTPGSGAVHSEHMKIKTILWRFCSYSCTPHGTGKFPTRFLKIMFGIMLLEMRMYSRVRSTMEPRCNVSRKASAS